MRVLKDNKSSLPAGPESENLEDKEIAATCTKCLSSFAFRQADAEVVTTNELDFYVNCPVCKTPLEIGKHTGIVRQVDESQ